MTEETIPSSILLRFFTIATERLLNHPSSDQDDDDVTTTSTKTLASHRSDLLKIQLNALSESVMEHGGNNTDQLIQVAQKALQKIGSRDFSLVSFSSSSKEEAADLILEASEKMNNAARMGFARVVMLSELPCEGIAPRDRNLRRIGDGLGSWDRSSILEFCGLCQAVMKLPEVIRYLKDGTDLKQRNVKKNDDDDGDEINQTSSSSLVSSPVAVNKRLERIQNLMVRAAGCDPLFATEEIKRLFMTAGPHGEQPKEASEDPELYDAFGKFVSAMTVAATNAMHVATKLSDGTTSVSSVQYSEHFVDASGNTLRGATAAPPAQSMGQREGTGPDSAAAEEDALRRRQADMMRQAAAMQQQMLGQLLSMDETQRDDLMKRGKACHEEFVNKSSALPPGPERMKLLQSMTSEQQKLMTMFRLWTDILAKNGGNPPKMWKKDE